MLSVCGGHLVLTFFWTVLLVWNWVQAFSVVPFGPELFWHKLRKLKLDQTSSFLSWIETSKSISIQAHMIKCRTVFNKVSKLNAQHECCPSPSANQSLSDASFRLVAKPPSPLSPEIGSLLYHQEISLTWAWSSDRSEQLSLTLQSVHDYCTIRNADSGSRQTWCGWTCGWKNRRSSWCFMSIFIFTAKIILGRWGEFPNLLKAHMIHWVNHRRERK